MERPVHVGQFRDQVARSIEHVRLRLSVLQAHQLPAPELRSLAVHVLEFALDLDQAWQSTCAVLLLLAPRMEQAGIWDLWRPFLERGIERSRQVSDRTAEAELLFHLGVLHQRCARPDDALAAYEASAALCAALEDPTGEARALNRQAYILIYMKHKLAQARARVDRALALPADGYERAYSDLVQGEIANRRRDWTTALTKFQAALNGWRAHGDRRMTARTLLCFGQPLTNLRRYDEAIQRCQEALHIFSELEDDAARALTCMNLGNISLALEQYLEALAHYATAESIFRRLHDETHLAKVYGNYGLVHRRLQNWQEAEAALHAAIVASQRLGDVRAQVNAMDELGLVYLDQGNRQQARATFAEALERLQALQNEPVVYSYLRTMVGVHVQLVEQGGRNGSV